jgi:CSLREA domain-containing protein
MLMNTNRHKNTLVAIAARLGVAGLILALAFLAQPVLPAHAGTNTWTVTKTADTNDGVCDSDCSLREAISAATSGDTVLFDSGLTGQIITVSSVLTMDKDLTIDGGTNHITVSGGNNVEVMHIEISQTVNLQNLTIANGKSDYGGGINNQGTLSITNVNVANNNATSEGGGIENGYTLIVTNSTFSNNNALNYGVGGAISSGGPLTITNSTFSGNSARQGGGIFSNGSLNVTDSTFSNNTAINYGVGGGIYNMNTLTVTNSTFSGNTAGSEGGAIDNDDVLTVTNSTFSGNSANSWGAALYNDGSATLTNSIFASSSSRGNCDGNDLPGGANNLADDNTCGSGFTNSANIVLGTLGSYGGSTQTIPLLPGSAAIDAGDNTVCAAGVGSPNYGAGGYDQRGIARGTTCDIGAFESRGFTMTKTGGDIQSTPVGSNFTNPLALTVSSAYGEPVDNGVVTFTAPATGASTNPAVNTSTITGGAVSQSVTANSTAGGPYTVTASAAGAASVDFSLTNMCLANVTVMNESDNDPGSLRQAISEICAGGTISFDYDTSIDLSSALTINKDLTIDGGTNQVWINGDDSVQVMVIGSGNIVNLQNITISHGYSSTDGGGINNLGTLTITNSTFTGNNADSGGGAIFNNGTLTVANSTFYNNSAYAGGGLENFYLMTVTNSTFSGNDATYGSGLYNDYPATVTNSIIANSDSGDNCSGTIGGSNNLADDGSCGSGFTNSASIQLGDLADNGGSTRTIELLPGSSAIDTGNDTVCAAAVDSPNYGAGGYDQRGVKRPQGPHCDIGAFEYRDTEAPTVTAFSAPSTSTSLTIPITTFTATDDIGVTAYMITTSATTPPLSTNPNWLGSKPTTYHVAADGHYTLYPWAKDAAGNVSAVYGSPASVTVNTTTPFLVSPTSGAKVPTFRPTFKWLAVPGITKYQIEVSKSASLTAPLVNATVTTLSYTPTVNLPANIKLYWSVRTVKSNGTTGAWTTPYYSFTIGLTAPTLTTPSNKLTGVAHKPAFKWQAVSGATSYTIEVSTSSTFSTMVINVKVSAASYTSTITLLGNKVYYWRVMATGVVGSSPWSSVFHFTTTP